MRGASIYGGMAPAAASVADLAALLEQRTAELHAAAASVTDRYRALELHEAAAARLAATDELPAHHCGTDAMYVHTYEEFTGHGRAVWLLYRCQVCRRVWDVLSDNSDESVITASVYPIFAVTSCGLCCRGECQGTPQCCPCHKPPEGVIHQ